MQVTMYGVRGSCPCAGDPYRQVGGNTSCVLVRVAGEPPLVLDLGTGLRALGDVLGAEAAPAGVPLRANALLTHLHFDHILGLPFFSPLHDPASSLTVYGPQPAEGRLREVLARAVRPPYFPVPMAHIGGDIAVEELAPEPLRLGGVEVSADRVPHPGATLGFRVEADGCAVAYVPDHQAPADRKTVAPEVLALCEGVDLLVHDAQYTEGEFDARATWGHSTVAYAVRVAARSHARRLLLFHHDPSRSDAEVADLLGCARALPEAAGLEDISVAVEGLSVELSRT